MDRPVPTVFISYSHADEEWKERLVEQLSVLADEHGFDVWDDRRIGAGDDWKAQIEQALTTARVAVLLVSVDFLRSRFIRGEEVPRLLRRREHDKLPIVPVLVRACPWDEIDWLKRLQMRPNDARPLAAGTPHEIESHLTAIAKEIAKLVRARATAPQPRPPRDTADERDEPPAVEVPQAPTPPVPPKLPQPHTPHREPRRFPSIKVAASVVGIAVVALFATSLGSALLARLRSRPVIVPTPAVAVTTLPTPTPGWLPAAPPGVRLSPISFQTVRVDERGSIVERREGHAQAFSEDLGGGVMLEMVAIPGGAFRLGSPADEADRDVHEGPECAVIVAPFFIGQFEVTQTQWHAVSKTFRSVERDLETDPSGFKGADRPVELVSWQDAVEFCGRLSQMTGRNYRLPSEVEWEYAARAGTQTPFAFGPTITPELVNYNGNYPYGAGPKGRQREQTTKVGELGASNAFGLFDAHGNVWEWVQDVWHDNYAGRPTDGRAWVAGGEPTLRVLRGGSWNREARYCRSAARFRSGPSGKNRGFGFRVACAVSRTQ